jgi:shikimate dehydrogenase
VTNSWEVDYVNGKTRIFGIVGHPIEQVRSPEMITAELVSRGLNSLMVPVHVLPANFDRVMPELLKLQNFDGFVFTIPFKGEARRFASQLGPQASFVGAVNALVRTDDGQWLGDIFDGLGCVEAFRRRDVSFAGKRVMMIGVGGAGSAIAVAVGREGPASMRIFDPDAQRAEDGAEKVRRCSPSTQVEIGEPVVDGIDVLINASPVGMLDDTRMPIRAETLPRDLIVFDAIVKPEMTRLLSLARDSGCTFIQGREMMRGQISKIVDFFQTRDFL